MSKRIAVIVEGAQRELNYWASIERMFFHHTEFKIIPLSAEANLYMIWKQFQDDAFYTDIIELVRERSALGRRALEGYLRDDFQEVYLFFDFDPQQNNLGRSRQDSSRILADMVQTFDNETENGKLYISYPMCEALRDIQSGSCCPVSGCLFSYDDLSHYKQLSGDGSSYVDHRKYTEETWYLFLSVFLYRASCLFNQSLSQSELLQWAKNEITPFSLLKAENELMHRHRKIFVLSAFPEFLLDYFSVSQFQNSLQTISQEKCQLSKPLINTDPKDSPD